MKRFKNILCLVDAKRDFRHALQMEADLFVMGNTADTIHNHIDCSMLAIKPPCFETPVTLVD